MSADPHARAHAHAPATPTLDTVRAAARRIAPTILQTPLVTSALSEAAGAPFYLKLESLQPTGSFKLRGASNAVASLPKGTRAVVCASTGNHGRALAHAARQRGVNAIVCLSSLVPELKVKAVEALGAEVRRVGRSQDDAQAEVDRLVAEGAAVEVPPFDHAAVISGQGTIALELLSARPEIETLLVPLSGGGLIAGIAIAAKALKPSVRIIGVSMARGAAMAASLDAGRPVLTQEQASLADSLGGGIGLENRHTFGICQSLVDEVILLSEEEIYRGMRALFREDALVAEGACAVGHAAVLAGKVRLSGPTATIITGRNVDRDQFAAVASGAPVRLADGTVVEDRNG